MGDGVLLRFIRNNQQYFYPKPMGQPSPTITWQTKKYPINQEEIGKFEISKYLLKFGSGPKDCSAQKFQQIEK